MKGKGLVPLLVIALILVGLVLWKRTSTPTRTISGQVELTPLLPEDVGASDITKLELYTGAVPDDRVVLERGDGEWRVASHFNAPVAESKIDEYLDALEELKGEFRETAATDDDLKPFQLTDEQAFHVLGYAKDTAEPAFHLLVGKAADYRTVFMKSSDRENVYVEATNLRQLAGVFGEDTATAPTASPWLDKTVLELDTETLAKIEIQTPDKALVFEKQAIPAEEPEPPAEDSEEAVVLEPQVEEEWVVASGGPGGELKKAGIENLVRKLGNLTASDLVDPATKSEYGLEPPQFKATIHRKEGEPVVIEGGRAEGAADGYIRVASVTDDRVYKVDSYSFGQLFPKGSTLFTLQGFSYPQDAIDRIEVTQPQGNYVVVRDGDTWAVQSPAAALPAQTATIDTLATMLQSWKPEDYADTAEGTGLDNPERMISFSVGGGDQVRMAVGEASKNFDGYYARVEGTDRVLALSKTDYQKVFVEPKNLYQLTLIDAMASDVESVAVERAEDSFTMEKDAGEWTLTRGPAAAPVDQDAADALAAAVAGVQATGLIEGESAVPAPIATIRVATADGATQWAVGSEQDGRYPVMLVERSQGVWVDAADLDAVLVGSASLTEAPQAAEISEDAEVPAGFFPPATTTPGAESETAPAPEQTITVAPSEPVVESDAAPVPEETAAEAPPELVIVPEPTPAE